MVGHAAIVPDDFADPTVQIYVDQAERNRGIDSELVKQVIVYADDQHRKLTVDLSAANEGVVRSIESADSISSRSGYLNCGWS